MLTDLEKIEWLKERLEEAKRLLDTTPSPTGWLQGEYIIVPKEHAKEFLKSLEGSVGRNDDRERSGRKN